MDAPRGDKGSESAEAPPRIRLLLIVSVFAVAVCGLVYELLAASVSSYLLGDTVFQFSLVIGIFLSAMGVGSFAAKYIERNLVRRFLELEVAIGLVGGFSGALLFAVFAYDLAYTAVLLLLVGSLGCLIGLEIPLVVRIFRAYEVLKVTISHVLSADYLGALFAAILFPTVFVPQFGLIRTGFLFGLMNIAVCWVGIWFFRSQLGRLRSLKLTAALATCVLVAGFFGSGRMVGFLEEEIYQDDILIAKTTPYQRIVVTRFRGDVRLYLNGNLQFSTADEHRYHEALVHPVMSLVPHASHVLVLGGGDGLAVREVLKYGKRVRKITLVDIDPVVVKIFREVDLLKRVNGNSLNDSRVHVVHTDALKFLEDSRQVFDVIIQDLPDPNNLSLGKLYTRSFFGLIGRRLGRAGAFVTQSTSPFFAQRAFWCIVRTIEESFCDAARTNKFYTKPYHVNVPSFGIWGFVLAAKRPFSADELDVTVPTRFLNRQVIPSLFVFTEDMGRVQTEANRLDNQVLVKYYRSDWDRWKY